MDATHLIILLSSLNAIQCFPAPESDSGNSQNYVPGVFISVDTLKNLQSSNNLMPNNDPTDARNSEFRPLGKDVAVNSGDILQTNPAQQEQVANVQAVAQPIQPQVQNQQPVFLATQQQVPQQQILTQIPNQQSQILPQNIPNQGVVSHSNQPILIAQYMPNQLPQQQVLLNQQNQPVLLAQQPVQNQQNYQQPMLLAQSSLPNQQQQQFLVSQQNNPNEQNGAQQILFSQQPLQNQPQAILLNQQPNQPTLFINQQGNQAYLLNQQGNQPALLMNQQPNQQILQPMSSLGQQSYLSSNPGQNQGYKQALPTQSNLYALVPANGQSNVSNGVSILQLPSNLSGINSGK